MDIMTAKRCKLGEGRLDFARVLVEFDVMKGFKEKIEMQYKDKNNVKKGYGNCTKRERTAEEIVMDTKRKEEAIKRRNEEIKERNNNGCFRGN
ncbi:hypothetical protein Tco_0807223 [Tanacetum coccineum]